MTSNSTSESKQDLSAWKGTLLGVEDELINAFASADGLGSDPTPLAINDEDADNQIAIEPLTSNEHKQRHIDLVTIDGNEPTTVTQQASVNCSMINRSTSLLGSARSSNTTMPSRQTRGLPGEQENIEGEENIGSCIEPVKLLRLDPETLALLPPPRRNPSLGSLAISDWSAIGSIASELLVGVDS